MPPQRNWHVPCRIVARPARPEFRKAAAAQPSTMMGLGGEGRPSPFSLAQLRDPRAAVFAGGETSEENSEDLRGEPKWLYQVVYFGKKPWGTDCWQGSDYIELHPQLPRSVDQSRGQCAMCHVGMA